MRMMKAEDDKGCGQWKMIMGTRMMKDEDGKG